MIFFPSQFNNNTPSVSINYSLSTCTSLRIVTIPRRQGRRRFRNVVRNCERGGGRAINPSFRSPSDQIRSSAALDSFPCSTAFVRPPMTVGGAEEKKRISSFRGVYSSFRVSRSYLALAVNNLEFIGFAAPPDSTPSVHQMLNNINGKRRIERVCGIMEMSPWQAINRKRTKTNRGGGQVGKYTANVGCKTLRVWEF